MLLPLICFLLILEADDCLYYSGVRDSPLSLIILPTMLNVASKETLDTGTTRTSCAKGHNMRNMRWYSCDDKSIGGIVASHASPAIATTCTALVRPLALMPLPLSFSLSPSMHGAPVRPLSLCLSPSRSLPTCHRPSLSPSHALPSLAGGHLSSSHSSTLPSPALSQSLPPATAIVRIDKFERRSYLSPSLSGFPFPAGGLLGPDMSSMVMRQGNRYRGRAQDDNGGGGIMTMTSARCLCLPPIPSLRRSSLAPLSSVVAMACMAAPHMLTLPLVLS